MGHYIVSDNKEFASALKFFYLEGTEAIDMKARRSGRSFLMTRILIENYIESGVQDGIKMRDHHDFKDNRQLEHCGYNNVRDVLKWYADRGVDIKYAFKGNNNLHFSIDDVKSREQYLRICIQPFITRNTLTKTQKPNHKLLLLS